MKTLVKLFFFIVVVSNIGVLASELSVPAPTGNATQYFCESESLTLADAAIFNTPGYTDIYWYIDANQTGSAIDSNTSVMPGDVYFAFQAVDPDSDALEVDFMLIDVIPAPHIDGGNPIAVCDNEDFTLGDLLVYNTTGFDTIYWFGTPDQQAGTELDPDTILVEYGNYYAFQGIGDCAEELLINIDLTDVIVAPYTNGSIPIAVCENEVFTLRELPVFNTDGFAEGIYWFSSPDQQVGTELDPDTIAIEGVSYYAFQGFGDCAMANVISIEEFSTIPAPITDGNPIAVCQSHTYIESFHVFNTDGFDGIYWFTTPDQQAGSELGLYALAVEGATYYAFQGLGTCADALAVTVEWIETIEAPVIDGGMPISTCENEEITLGELPIFNTTGFDGIYWFSTSNQAYHSELNFNTIVEEGVSYYAYQGLGNCAVALEVTVEVEPIIPAPDGETNQNFCYEQTWTLNDVVVINNNGYTNIYWFDDTLCNGGQQLDTNTVINDGDIYYALQGINACCPGALEVQIHIPQPYPAPTGPSDQYFNEGEDFTLGEAEVYNTAGFDGIYWYTDEEQTSDPVEYDTVVEDADVYYAFQAICSCDCQLALPLQVTFHKVLAVDEFSDTFSFFPNMINNELVFSLNKVYSRVDVLIFDTKGNTVYKNKNSRIIDNEYRIDMTSYSSGIYFLTIKTPISGKSFKFIKQ